MRFMIMVKATRDTEAEEIGVVPDQQLMADMASYHEDLAKAGVLLDGAGLRPSRWGWRIHYSAGDKRSVTDGPFAETKELIAGYTVIQVRSREEAMEWSRRFPNPMGRDIEADIEVRQLFELEDFGETQNTQRLRDLGMG